MKRDKLKEDKTKAYIYKPFKITTSTLDKTCVEVMLVLKCVSLWAF